MKTKTWVILFIVFIAFFQAHADYDYSLSWDEPHTHTYRVELRTQPLTDSYTDFAVAAWRPGRYIIQNYAASVSHFTAHDPDGNALKWGKTNKDTWRVFHNDIAEVVISWRYYANNQDAGSSYLGEEEAYFNPVNFFMYKPGKLNDPVRLEVLSLPKKWNVATALKKTDQKNVFTAGSWHEFADSPTVFAKRMKQMEFEIDGVNFYLHFQGNYQGDMLVDEAIQRDIREICKAQANIFGGFPFEEYHFIYRLLDFRMRHAVEHSFSSCFTLPGSITSSLRPLTGSLYGITSHEFWHAWNVKRIRPSAIWPYDYSKEAYTSQHWFTEGVTEYYTYLMLFRAGLITEGRMYEHMARGLDRLDNAYSTKSISPAAASFNSWLSTSPYRHPHLNASYYALGQRLGLLMDLSLRKETEGKVSLDDVFRYLYKEYYQKDMGVPEDGIQLAMEELTGTPWQDFFDNYVNGTQSPDFESLLSPFGLQLTAEEKTLSGLELLGIQQAEETENGFFIQALHPDGDAYANGIVENDLILSFDNQPALDAVDNGFLSTLNPGDKVKVSLFSENKMKTVELEYRAAYQPMEFALKRKAKQKKQQEKLLEGWLYGN